MTGIVLQARMGSTRLPGKIMKELCGQPMIGHILDRLKSVRNADIVVLATSNKTQDDRVAAFAEQKNVACFRGDEADVLDRYYQASLYFKLKTIVRATGDNPFLDPEEIERLISFHQTSDAEYSSALNQLPIGVGCECFSIDALRRSWEEGHLPHHREHVDEYILENPLLFRNYELIIPLEKCSPTLRLTVDTPEDFEKAMTIYSTLYSPGRHIATSKIIALCATLSV